MSEMSETIRKFPMYLPSGLHTDEAADELESKDARIKELEDRLHRINQWCKAYPRTVFIEPTKKQWATANKVLNRTDCPSLTAISGSNMRHVVEGIAEISKEPDNRLSEDT